MIMQELGWLLNHLCNICLSQSLRGVLYHNKSPRSSKVAKRPFPSVNNLRKYPMHGKKKEYNQYNIRIPMKRHNKSNDVEFLKPEEQ